MLALDIRVFTTATLCVAGGCDAKVRYWLVCVVFYGRLWAVQTPIAMSIQLWMVPAYRKFNALALNTSMA